MVKIVRRAPDWLLFSLFIGGAGLLVLTLVTGSGAAVKLHRENQRAQTQITEAQAAIDQLAARNAAQDFALRKANQRLKRIGEDPVDPSAESPFPFTFVFTVGTKTYTVTCSDHLACLVQAR